MLIYAIACDADWNRSPDNAKVRPKMTYASSKDALRKALVGIQVELQANDIADIDYETGTPSSYPHLFHRKLRLLC